MAYTAKTWAVNEVITSTALNNLETGAEEAYLMSEAVIDADKDWNDKKITNLKSVSISVTGSDASDTVKASSAATASTTSDGIWEFLKEFTIPNGYYNATFRVKFTVSTNYSGLVYAAVARNGTILEESDTGDLGAGGAISRDVDGFSALDKLQICAKCTNAAGKIDISSASVCGTDTEKTLILGDTPASW